MTIFLYLCLSNLNTTFKYNLNTTSKCGKIKCKNIINLLLYYIMKTVLICITKITLCYNNLLYTFINSLNKLYQMMNNRNIFSKTSNNRMIY